MRAKYFLFAPSAVDDDGIADDLTGAGPWDASDFIRTDVPDGLAHTISLTSTANLSGIDITITGTDADGAVISETLAGPNNNTVETTKYFKTVTSISAASTLSTNTLLVGWANKVASQTIPLDTYARPPATVQLTITGTASIDVEDTISNIRDGGEQSSWTWLVDANFDDRTASVGGNLSVSGLRAMRMVFNSYSTDAVVELAITQAR
jgi:hypothetical protein